MRAYISQSRKLCMAAADLVVLVSVGLDLLDAPQFDDWHGRVLTHPIANACVMSSGSLRLVSLWITRSRRAPSMNVYPGRGR